MSERVIGQTCFGNGSTTISNNIDSTDGCGSGASVNTCDSPCSGCGRDFKASDTPCGGCGGGSKATDTPCGSCGGGLKATDTPCGSCGGGSMSDGDNSPAAHSGRSHKELLHNGSNDSNSNCTISDAMAALEVSASNGNPRPPSQVNQLLSEPESDAYNSPTDHPADAHTVGRSLPADLPSHISHQWLLKVANDIVRCLNTFGIAVINKFLGHNLGAKILQEAILLHDRHLMTDGQTISPYESEHGNTEGKKYRMDKISWVNGVEGDCHSIGTLATLLDTIMQLAQDKLGEYHIKGRTKAMVACYPGRGSYYVRHVDNPYKDGRLLTCIYYLNKNWNDKADGGMLRIYPEGSSRVAAIAPVMDRLLVFWSDKRNPHEVTPAFKTRYAVTMWYFDASERTEAMKREANKQSSSNGHTHADRCPVSAM